MDSIVKIKQVINSLESQVIDEEVKTLELLLVKMGKEIQEQGDAYTIVKMMQSIGRYLATRTSNAHPDTIPLLSSLADSLEILDCRPLCRKRGARDSCEEYSVV